jgi:hypothetical protein
LRDAPLYITKLSKAEHDAEDWWAAMEVPSKCRFTIVQASSTGLFAGAD